MTYAANRLRRRRALKALPFTDLDRERYARLVGAAAKTAADPLGGGKTLAKGRNGVRGRTLPPGQAVAGAAFDRLCRLADRWTSMLATARIEMASELGDLAAECGAVLGALDAAAARRATRADIEG